ncbi:hypothetical protein [Thalassiella azotivora]
MDDDPRLVLVNRPESLREEPAPVRAAHVAVSVTAVLVVVSFAVGSVVSAVSGERVGPEPLWPWFVLPSLVPLVAVVLGRRVGERSPLLFPQAMLLAFLCALPGLSHPASPVLWTSLLAAALAVAFAVRGAQELRGVRVGAPQQTGGPGRRDP